MSEELPDYPGYDLVELLEAITGLDRVVYAERGKLILHELRTRYPDAWSLFGARLEAALASDEDIPLKTWVAEIPPEMLIADQALHDDAGLRHYEDAPDYDAYSGAELIQALNSVDPAQYPQRQDQLMAEIRDRFPDKFEEAQQIVESKR